MKPAAVYFAALALICMSITGCSRESKTVNGSVIRGERARHTLNARAGQTLEVNVTSEEDNAVFQIYLPGEKGTLPGAGEMDDAKKFSGKVPADGEYVIVVGPTRGNATYKLNYSVK